MTSAPLTIVALSGGVDSAVAAWLLQSQGRAVECLHMSNWDDDDGYCDSAADLQDARAVCDTLGLTLHRVNFAREYRDNVFAEFLREMRAGRTPNPDVLCNREIKFGVLRRYARRLGASRLATGHYARLDRIDGAKVLLKGRDTDKDQSYFLSAVGSDDLDDVDFPLGDLDKTEVRQMARDAGLAVSSKPDSTGICFIGERPFNDFIDRFLSPSPGRIVTDGGATIGEHLGLHRYTLGQRKGIGIGGLGGRGDDPWYVAGKRPHTNELVVVQGHDHPLLYCDALVASQLHWIGPEPDDWRAGNALRCQVKTRYRQRDQSATLRVLRGGEVGIDFDQPQRAVTPGQQAVLYRGERCLGSARIERTSRRADVLPGNAQAL